MDLGGDPDSVFDSGSFSRYSNRLAITISYERISMKFYGWVESDPTTNQSDFGGNPIQDPGILV